MKKFFGILAIAAALTACNNEGTTTGERKDSIDSVANAQKNAVDSSADAKKDAIDTSAKMQKDAVDTAAKAVDSTKK